MVGRVFCCEEEAVRRGFGGWECARRREVLRETIAAFERAEPGDRYHRLAKSNLDRWRAEQPAPKPGFRIEVYPDDWGTVTAELTRRYGTCFAVLNMANAYKPGGAYVEGAIAQEENMFRRTDCHFRIGDQEMDRETGRYRPEMTRLLTAQDGAVYLDVEHPRVCIRGPEDRQRADLGYPWLVDEDVFPFFELRAAAQDLRGGIPFSPQEARKRIAVQLDTLQAAGLRHAVLSAFGCGAFQNPAEQVAEIYGDEIALRREAFDVIAFAVYWAGYGRDNFTPFQSLRNV